MGCTYVAEETHTQPRQHAQAVLCHRRCHGRDVGALQRSVIFSDGTDLQSSVGLRFSLLLPGFESMRAWRMEWGGPSLSRPSPASVAATSRFGTCGADPRLEHGRCRARPLEPATQRGSSVSNGDAQSEFESSGREAALPAESLPANCLNPRSNLVRQVTLRRRRIQYGHLDRGRAQRGMSSKVNVYDERLQLDNPERKFLEPRLKKLRGQGKTGPPVLCQLRHGGASHKAFTAFRDVTGMQKESRWSSFSGPRRYEKAARIPQLLQAASPQELRWTRVYRRRSQLLSARCGTVSALRQKKFYSSWVAGPR